MPQVEDATAAAQQVLEQYAALIRERTERVRTFDLYTNGAITKDDAISALQRIYPNMKAATARRQLAHLEVENNPDYQPREPDMRFGWLLWQESLREFLYFEERMAPPDPRDFYARWDEKEGARRKATKNLWVFERATELKRYSITNEAGPKVQPYFNVPAPNDPNLYHFVVQGEPNGDLIRVWLTEITAELLKRILGDLETPTVSAAILAAGVEMVPSDTKLIPRYEAAAVPIMITKDAYAALEQKFPGVSDEHRIQLFLRHRAYE